MINSSKLKGRIIEKGFSVPKMAGKVNVTPKTFYIKLEKGDFKVSELEKMMPLLGYESMDDFF